MKILSCGTFACCSLLLLLCAQQSYGLKCYICNNCIKYELSQSRPCPSQQTQCMKMKMETGQVQRSCGTEAMCSSSETALKTHYTSVSCCNEDNCNGAPAQGGSRSLAALLLVLLPLHAAHTRYLS
ncbi:hypothetical protein FHG87_001611 [Trinorchestia longiramus]|nr:hypothetical protein FHG87_001611 [Trinorchestia longiramus]